MKALAEREDCEAEKNTLVLSTAAGRKGRTDSTKVMAI